MVAQIVSKILNELTSMGIDELKRRGKLVAGAEEAVNSLVFTFSAIESLLLDAEERQLTDKGVEDWVTKLKNVCYKIDDVLDEWRTEILKHQIEEEAVNDADFGWFKMKLLEVSDLLKRVCPFLPTYCFSCVEIGHRYNVASRVEELYKSLDRINQDKTKFDFTSRGQAATDLYKSLPTSSNLDTEFSNVKGREVEIKILRKKLLEEDCTVASSVQSISIQGSGGLGKTTLAKLLYNDEAVEAHFDKRIWVCVSETFDPNTIVKTILESLVGSAPQTTALSNMLRDVQKEIKGKRFLLVLDDVWEHSSSKWKEVRNSFLSGAPGSKILVTTRKGEASRALGCIEDRDVVAIGKISDDAYHASQIAFNGWNPEDQGRLEDLCQGLVRKCSGSPLAANILGGVLQGKRSRKEWLDVLQSEMWQLEEVKEEVFRPLALSYYDLIPEIRQCFQFCSVFPKGCELEKDQLIKLWMAQSFVRSKDDLREMEDIGESYFQILARRSFFHDFQKNQEIGMTEVTHCKMHDFARLISKSEWNINMKSICDKEDVTTFGASTALRVRGVVRHLNIDCDFMNYDLMNGTPDLLSVGKDLRSFIVTNADVMDATILPWNHLLGTRSLVLKQCNLKEIPSVINQLIHLRHLDLSDNEELVELPDEICELYNLLSLILNENSGLEKLPVELGNKLVNLKHFENANVLALLPKSIGRLTSLKTLREFRFCKDSSREGGATITDLKDMNQLRGTLHVFGLSKVADCTEVEQAHFSQKTSLTCLWLWFGGNNEEEEESDEDDDSSEYEDDNDNEEEEEEEVSDISNKDEQVLEAARPSTNLEELFILGYRGASMSPSWMMNCSLVNLTQVTIEYCKNVKHLPPLGSLSALEELRLIGMMKVEKVGEEFLGGAGDVAFPKLRVLGFQSMPKWKMWDGTTLKSPSVMPQLELLNLSGCYRLTELPDEILRKTKLETLVVYGACFGGYELMSSKAWERISHVPNIIIDGVHVQTESKRRK
ncbi:Putative disease resistance protein RGA4 [Linum perenne]